jgi:zinc/manganese transport system permease protein
LSVAITVAVGLTVTWLGLAVAYFTPYPIGFFVTTFAFAAYVAAALVGRTGWRRTRAMAT